MYMHCTLTVVSVYTCTVQNRSAVLFSLLIDLTDQTYVLHVCCKHYYTLGD
jgi:hypothetical protein